MTELNSNNSNNLLEMINISKYYPGVMALKKVNFSIKSGEVHALIGENGAGKTTCISILGGSVQPDEGAILLNGKEIKINSSGVAEKVGISVIHQEFPLVEELNVSQNIYLGREIGIRFGFNRSKEMDKRVRDILSKFGLNIDAKKLIKDLPTCERQLVEIARALNSDSWLIVMDEPTSSLSLSEKEHLFKIIRQLKAKNTAIVYISHHISEVFEIADKITVFRNGESQGTYNASEMDESKAINLMLGGKIKKIFVRERVKSGKTVLEVKRLSRSPYFKNISFKVKAGEVVGLSGLIGAGRTELAKCIFGMDKFDSGEIYINGSKIEINNPGEAVINGLGYVTEDRRKEGIINLMSVKENISLPSLTCINKLGWINDRMEENIFKEWSSKLGIKVSSPDQKVMNLSGGNQQKVTLSKWLARNPKLLILDEPTRGIDVGAKLEIYKIIENLAKNNMAILLISSEMAEITGVCDKVMVFYRGSIVREFDYSELNEQDLFLSVSGFNNSESGKKTEISTT